MHEELSHFLGQRWAPSLQLPEVAITSATVDGFQTRNLSQAHPRNHNRKTTRRYIDGHDLQGSTIDQRFGCFEIEGMVVASVEGLCNVYMFLRLCKEWPMSIKVTHETWNMRNAV